MEASRLQKERSFTRRRGFGMTGKIRIHGGNERAQLAWAAYDRAVRDMDSGIANSEYKRLLRKFPPKVIHSEKQNERYARSLYELDQRSGKLTRAEKELAELLTLLIEDFESKRYELPRAKPLEVVRFLMDQHKLKQKDLVDVFGARSIVSEVLSGKRKLNKEHIARLSERFHVSADVFF
jgi:HTH-type transcriptional regulator/antitoxin HigA